MPYPQKGLSTFVFLLLSLLRFVRNLLFLPESGIEVCPAFSWFFFVRLLLLFLRDSLFFAGPLPAVFCGMHRIFRPIRLFLFHRICLPGSAAPLRYPHTTPNIRGIIAGFLLLQNHQHDNQSNNSRKNRKNLGIPADCQSSGCQSADPPPQSAPHRTTWYTPGSSVRQTSGASSSRPARRSPADTKVIRKKMWDVLQSHPFRPKCRLQQKSVSPDIAVPVWSQFRRHIRWSSATEQW